MFTDFKTKTEKETLPYRRENGYSVPIYKSKVKMRVLIIIEDFCYYQWWEKLFPSISATMTNDWLTNNNEC